jgi:hypothetical protein
MFVTLLSPILPLIIAFVWMRDSMVSNEDWNRHELRKVRLKICVERGENEVISFAPQTIGETQGCI